MALAGERRDVALCLPGGYHWTPKRGDTVLVVKGGAEGAPCIVGTPAGQKVPAGIAACTNPAAFTGGREEEEDEAFRARILATYRQLPNGTNAAAYAQQTLAVEGVCAVNVLPKKRGLGTVDVVITSAGGVPGTALVEQVQSVLEEQREIAVDVNVMAPETVTVDLILSVKPKEGLLPGPVIDRVKAALRAWFDGSLLGQDVLLAQIGQKIFAVDGVANYQIQGPVNDVTVGRGQLPVLGKLSVEELR